jgi:hypothetical protein
LAAVQAGRSFGAARPFQTDGKDARDRGVLKMAAAPDSTETSTAEPEDFFP